MRAGRYPIVLFSFTILLVLLALAAESLYFSDFEYSYRTNRFNKTLAARETVMEECLNLMRPILAQENHHGSVSENDLFSIAEKNQISILEYFDNKLVYWSDNGFDVPNIFVDSLFRKPIVFLQNGWFLPKVIESGNERVIGLLRLHTDYGFENNIIKSGFEKEFRIPQNVGLSFDKNNSKFQVFNKEGEFLFSLNFPAEKTSTWFVLLPLSLWTAAFVMMILLTFQIVKLLSSKGKVIHSLILAPIVFSLIYIFILLSEKPLSMYHTELFSPYLFTLNKFIPSPGHLAILSILLSAFAVILFRYLPLKQRNNENKTSNYFLLSCLMTAGAAILCVYQWIFSQLISESNINFETYKVLELSIFSLIGMLSILLLLIFPVLYFLKIFRIFTDLRNDTLILSFITSLVVPVAFFFKSPETLIPFFLFFCALVMFIRMLLKRPMGFFNMSVVFSLITGFYFLYFVTILSEQKITENLKIQAVSFSTENDPEAERLLLDLWPQIEKDPILAQMMKVPYFDTANFDKISDYLQDTYFTGFWKNYNISLYLCQSDQPLQIGTEKSEDCFSFFDRRIRRDGHRLTGTNCYFIDNQGGRSHYLGRAYYPSVENKTNGLFLELYNDPNIFTPGYSELLVDKRYHGYAGLKEYSFAKYINGEMVLRTGEFPFDKTDADYIDKATDYKVFRVDGYKQVLYKNGNATVIIGRPVLTAGDVIISFAYLFAFILLFSNLIILLVRRPSVKAVTMLNFRQKLQLSFIGILLFSFILIGIVVAYITIGQYKTKHYENIKEKLNSVYIEIDNRLSAEKYLSADWSGDGYQSLNELLIKLSNVFNTDINLYNNVNGFLIATSRQEVFDRNLLSQRMNNAALNNLAHLTKSEYYQKEKIGKLEYLSAYVPFFNTENKVIAYLNLPYFRMQSVLAKEISNLIVAVINFTLLLIVITMALAVFISGRLTSPLAMLGTGLATVGVGKKSEHLVYNGKDEIGELVRQYNRMVDEIEESSHKLANSEREYAWREMAKQIAHEIKNPLTPMKLNVQQLFKSWNDKIPGFDKALERFTRNQIEYIDNLSSIASAFSSFAKMPVTNPIEVNILDEVKIALELFKNTDNTKFTVSWPHETKIVIYADREQLKGVFSNLIKNSIQAIPTGQEGHIILSIEVIGDKVIVSVADNGTGIPPELRKNLFTPNFTTKSSGMGLGLSIAKKYIESANGRMWFESEEGKGSAFYFELPVMYTVEKPEIH
jgi:two-component system, NtrC family, nitrogen regulation sensor histidine kinase NtrY